MPQEFFATPTANVANSPFQAVAGSTVMIDASQGQVEVKAPAGRDGAKFAAYVANDANRIQVTTETPAKILPIWNAAAGAAINLVGQGTHYEWLFDPATNIWRPRGHERYSYISGVKTSADSPYLASPGELTLIDLASGDMTVRMPVMTGSPASVKNSIKHIGTNEVNTCTVEGNGANIEWPYFSVAPESTVQIFGSHASVDYFWHGTEWRVGGSHLLAAGNFADVWRATPVADMNPGGTIVWTFQAEQIGRLPVWASHSAGTFTMSRLADLEIDATFLFQMNLNANNADVDWAITHVTSGSGTFNLIPLLDSFAHSRIGTFQRTDTNFGTVRAQELDTLRFDYSATGTGGSTVGLVEAILVMKPEF